LRHYLVTDYMEKPPLIINEHLQGYGAEQLEQKKGKVKKQSKAEKK